MNKVQRSPNILPLYQIRHLARLLNSLSSDNQEIGTSLTSNNNVTTESKFQFQYILFMPLFLSFYVAQV